MPHSTRFLVTSLGKPFVLCNTRVTFPVVASLALSNPPYWSLIILPAPTSGRNHTQYFDILSYCRVLCFN
jgi:hypothetical protein